MLGRHEWVSALNSLPVDEVISCATELSKGWEVRPKSMPQSGLGMLKLRESAFGETFYLGEFPFASAWLEVTTPDGDVAEGAAQVMDDRQELAESLAICDAVLAARLPGWKRVLGLLDKGQAAKEATARERKQILASTRVDFSLLDDAGDNDAQA
jgi:alpha-D-ribose 1-methylphosphonate 5-triphosphate synthase subunit PhnG